MNKPKITDTKKMFVNSGQTIVKPKKSQKLDNFPDDKDIEKFQAQLNGKTIKQLAASIRDQLTTLDTNVNIYKFQNFLNKVFNPPPVETLVKAMFERFKPFKLEGVKEDTHIVNEVGVDALDFVIGMNLLSRTTNVKKLKLLFELCDDDDDGCMTPEDILYMLKKVERVFHQECAEYGQEFHSTVLNNFSADQKAERKFNIIMGMIKSQDVIKRKLIVEQRQKRAKEGDSNANKKNRGVFGEEEEKEAEDSDDNLITNKEFMTAIKKLDEVKRRILPRTLTFKEVLQSTKTEDKFVISDTNVDDFAMFRYEINSVFRNHQFKPEGPSEFICGWNPLSKDRLGNQIRDMDEASKEKYQDMYRPPGLVQINYQYYDPNDKPRHFDLEKSSIMDSQNFGNTKELEEKKENFKSTKEKEIWMTIPTKQLYIRQNKESEYLVKANLKRFLDIEQKYQEADKKKKDDLKKQ